MTNMDPNISFDISSIVSDLSLNKINSEELMQTILRDISQAIIYSWREEAHRGLHGTRNSYINGIQEPKISGNISIIELIGTLPNMVENGAAAFDMKEGFSKSPKITRKENGGWFLTIPFRFATAEALGENEAFSNKMPGEVHSLAKELTASKSAPSGKMIYGGSLKESDLSAKHQGLKTRQEIKDKETERVLYGAYQHKSNIYSGMVRVEKTYEKSTQSQYFTFRRVSDTSDPLSWIHPGMIAKGYAEKAVSSLDVTKIIDDSANVFAKNLGL